MNKTFWVEVRISYDSATESGENIHLKETWLVRAATFAEAEARAVEAVSKCGDVCNVDVETCTKRNIAAVWVGSTADEPGKWYKVRCEVIRINEKTKKEKRCKRDYMVMDTNLSKAHSTFLKCMSDYKYEDIELLGINLTPITHVISMQGE